MDENTENRDASAPKRSRSNEELKNDKDESSCSSRRSSSGVQNPSKKSYVYFSNF